MNKNLIKGFLMLLTVLLCVAVGVVGFSDRGMEKLSCVGEAISLGVAFSSLHDVCGLSVLAQRPAK